MIQQQQTQAQHQAPGSPIGFAPIYAPPLANDAPVLPAPTPSNGPQRRWMDGFIVGGLIFGIGVNLAIWGVLDNFYAGADIRGLQRQANAANATAQAAEQRAASASAEAEQWQAHSQQQQSKMDQVREVLGCK